MIYPGANKSRGMRDRAVAIAQDVLERLQQKKLQLSWYVYVGLSAAWLTKLFHDAEPLQERLDEFEPHCHVCADGALFLSHIRLYNGADADDLRIASLTAISARMKGSFAHDELRLIEAVFQKQQHRLVGSLGDPDMLDRREAFLTQVLGAKAGKCSVDADLILAEKQATRQKHLLLSAICKNIVAHDGVFTLPELETV